MPGLQRTGLPQCLLLAMPLPAAASHAWAEIDICETSKDTLPPGLTLEALPEPASAAPRC